MKTQGQTDDKTSRQTGRHTGSRLCLFTAFLSLKCLVSFMCCIL